HATRRLFPPRGPDAGRRARRALAPPVTRLTATRRATSPDVRRRCPFQPEPMKPKAKRPVSPPEAGQEPAAQWVPTCELRPWADNPRKNDDAVPAVVASIKRFGFGAPILARRA